MIRVTVNGRPREATEPQALDRFLENLDLDPERVAVEHNGTVVRRGTYEHVTVEDGDRLEVVRIVGGG